MDVRAAEKLRPQAAARHSPTRLRIGRVFDALGYDRTGPHHLPPQPQRARGGLLHRASLLRGAFLMAGTVAGPDKKSHLELKSTHQSLAGEETSLMLDLGLCAQAGQARAAHCCCTSRTARASRTFSRASVRPTPRWS
ncbi:MAG: hypothetical protein ACLR4Z_08730 [Butyricicoccaceae bacterium]